MRIRHLITDCVTNHYTNGLDMETLTQLLAVEGKGEIVVKGKDENIGWTQERLYTILNGMECRGMIKTKKEGDTITYISKAA